MDVETAELVSSGDYSHPVNFKIHVLIITININILPKYWNYLTQTGSCCDLFTFIIFSEPLVHIDLFVFPQSFHLSQYLRLHGPKAGNSNSEDFMWGKLQDGAGSAITVIAVAKVEAEILHTWRWSSLWRHCSSVAMLVGSHLKRPDREVEWVSEWSRSVVSDSLWPRGL